jgi:hypothetical protein
MTYNDDNDPTGYYRRKQKKNDEYMDKVLFPFFKWAIVLLAVVVVVDLVRGCINSTASACPHILATR